MASLTLSLDTVRDTGLCRDGWRIAHKFLGDGEEHSYRDLFDAGVPLDHVVWVVSRLADTDADIKRRLLLWLSDVVAHVLPVCERAEERKIPIRVVSETRKFARGSSSVAAVFLSDDENQYVRSPSFTGAAANVNRAAAWLAIRVEGRGEDVNDRAYWVHKKARMIASEEAEERWQHERLVERFSDPEPADWPLELEAA
ncbi:hypothetical protein [Mesorhizobium sp. A623]